MAFGSSLPLTRLRFALERRYDGAFGADTKTTKNTKIHEGNKPTYQRLSLLARRSQRDESVEEFLVFFVDLRELGGFWESARLAVLPATRLHRIQPRRRLVVSPFDVAQGDPELVEGSSLRRARAKGP